ncbi:MAG: 50S ribosomal protein L2 [archaeon]|nr:50S ribosomal protein L2 [archaeon]
MPNRLKSQRSGKGSHRFLATKNAAYDIKYRNYSDAERNDVLLGQVVDLMTDYGKTSALAEIAFSQNDKEVVIAAEGMSVGKKVEYGVNAEVDVGNVLPLKSMPDGCPIFNIELHPGDGGKLVRSSGMFALVVTKDKTKVFVKLPSSKVVSLSPLCRATIGCAAAGGRVEKPFVKAGKRFHLMKSKRKHYPGLRGVAMNPVDHPFGGSQHHPGKSKSTSRHAPPGRKVGAIASKRTGRRKKG